MTVNRAYESDVGFASHCAQAAGQLLLSLRAHPPQAVVGSPRELGKLADQRANRLIIDEISRRHPEDAILSEESTDDPGRLTASRVWIVDPLDGTREYTHPDRSDWAVHIALWQRGHGITAAAVAAPARGLVATNLNPHMPPEPPSETGRLRILVSATRPPAVAQAVAVALHADLIPMGSAGAKTLAVVSGSADAYLHAGGQWEWDSAAPVGVARGAHLHASRIDGSPLTYNQPDPYLPDLLICRPRIADTLLASLSQALQSTAMPL